MSTTSIQITGNLTRDPDLHATTGGRFVARFDVAVNARRRTGSGEWVDGETAYYHCSVWGEQAEHVAECLVKGARVVVLGIGARSWTPTEGERAGETLTRLEVTADEVATSLRWATAAVTKPDRSTPTDAASPAERDATPPF